MNLINLRNKANLTQSDLVRISSVSRSVITKYERGERDINKAAGETLLKLATALNCNIEDLLDNKEEIIEEIIFNKYCLWRKNLKEEFNEEIHREFFSQYANKEITITKIKEMERKYEELNRLK